MTPENKLYSKIALYIALQSRQFVTRRIADVDLRADLETASFLGAQALLHSLTTCHTRDGSARHRARDWFADAGERRLVPGRKDGQG